jgi:hypothetical protein
VRWREGNFGEREEVLQVRIQMRLGLEESAHQGKSDAKHGK